MNYETKKSIMKVSAIFQIIIFVSETILALLSFLLGQLNILQAYGIYYPDYLSLGMPIKALVSTIYFCFLIIYLNKKQKQTKEQFYSKTKPFKAFAIVSLILSTGVGILLMFAAFTQDGEKTKFIQPVQKRTKKKIVYLDRETKRQIRILKSQKRHGIISDENYQKQYNQLLKKQKQLD